MSWWITPIILTILLRLSIIGGVSNKLEGADLTIQERLGIEKYKTIVNEGTQLFIMTSAIIWAIFFGLMYFLKEK